MSAKYQDMKLGKILTIAGCRMIPNGDSIDVTASDGVVVLRGGIKEIREQLAFNCHYYGEPIVHPSAKPFRDESDAVKTQRAAAAYRIDQAMDKELAIHKVSLDSDDAETEVSDSQSEVSSQPEFLQVIEKVAEGKGKQPVGLPDNRVGALQEHCQPEGKMPQYRFLRNRGPPHNPMHVCIVSVGSVTARGKAKTKKAAKHDAAGNLMQKLVGEPEKAGTGKGITQKEILEWGEQPILATDAELREKQKLFAQMRSRNEQDEAIHCGISEEAEIRNRRKLELLKRGQVGELEPRHAALGRIARLAKERRKAKAV